MSKFIIRGEYIILIFIIILLILAGFTVILTLMPCPKCPEVAAEKCIEYCISIGCICRY